MAHHGTVPPEFFNEELLNKGKNTSETLNPLPADESEIKTQLGATGKFPDGKLNDNDEGEIRVAIYQEKENIVINFGKPIVWVGFTKKQAIDIAISLLTKVI
jgi:hypothetical protein